MNLFIYRIFLVILLFFKGITSALAQERYSQLYRPLALGTPLHTYEIMLEGTSFKTMSYFDNDGKNITLDEGAKFSFLEGELTLRHGLSNKLKWEGGLRLRQNRSTHLSQEELVNTSVLGLESYFWKLQYLLYASHKLAYSLILQGRHTVYKNENFGSEDQLPQDQIILGDSGVHLSMGLGLSYRWMKRHTLDLWAALRKPGNNLSEEFPYRIRTTWAGKKWAFYLGADGIYSLRRDRFTNNPDQKPFQARGGTYLYNSLNRQYLVPHAGLYYALSNRLRLGFEGGQVAYGNSTDKGTRWTVNLQWSSGGTSPEQRKIHKFKEYAIEATVIKVSPRGKFIRIDKGISSGIQKNMKFDIFKTDFFGGNTLVAEGVAHEVGGTNSIIKLTKKIRKLKVKQGFIVRSE